MAVVAVSEITHGKPDGKVVTFGVGQTVSVDNEDQERALVESGAAIETGDNKKYKSPYYNPYGPVASPADEDTRKRDALIAGLVPEEERPAGDGTAAAPSLVGVKTSVDVAVERQRQAEADQAAALAKTVKTNK